MDRFSGVSPEWLRQQPDGAVLFICEGCGSSFAVRAQRILLQLRRRHKRLPATTDIATLLEKPCFNCGKTKWACRPAE